MKKEGHVGPVSLQWLLDSCIRQLDIFETFVEYFALMAYVKTCEAWTDSVLTGAMI